MAYDNLIIRARSITKSYGTEKVLSDFNLDVWNGAIVGILGVSGSGKTTALRLIAGFEKPDSGIIEMRNEIISNEEIYLPPEERNVGMVFQDYALFPHLDVKSNIAFGLSKNQINVDIKAVNSRFLDYKIKGININPNLENRIKKELFEKINNFIEPIRNRRKGLVKNIEDVKKELEKSSSFARGIAKKKIQQVRKAIGLPN